MTFEIGRSIAAFDPGRINDLYGERAEGRGFYRAWEEARGSIAHAFVVAKSGGRTTGGAPLFTAPFNWLSLVPGGEMFAGWFGGRFGNLPLTGIGSIHANELGAVAETPEAFADLIDGLEHHARESHSKLMVVKDVNERDVAIADPILRARGFARLQSPPLAYLHLPFASFEDFVGRLSQRRQSVRRNLRRARAVMVETDADVSGMTAELASLAAETRRRGRTQFGGLEATPPDYFEAIRRHAAEHCSFTLFRREGRLLGFVFSLEDRDATYSKTIGLRYPEAIEQRVYFRAVQSLIERCIERGVRWLCLGQLAYETKLALGAKLEKRWIYVKVGGWYTPAFRMSRRYIEAMRLDPASAHFDVPENYFTSDPAGPQPPVHSIFRTRTAEVLPLKLPEKEARENAEASSRDAVRRRLTSARR